MTTVREFITKWGFDVDFGPLEKMESETRKVRAGFLKLGAAATAVLAGIVVPAAMLEDELRKSAAAAGKTGDEFEKTLDKLTGKSMDFAEELGLAGNLIAKGFFNVISTGLDPLSKEFDDFSKTAFQLAKLTGGDVGETVSQLNTVLVAFRKDGETASSIANKFAKANTLADTSVAQLSQAARIAGPVMAQTFGGDLNTTIGLLAGFAEAGFKAEKGGESLKQVALRLAAPMGKAKTAIKDLELETTNSDGSFRNLIEILADVEAKTKSMTEARKAQIFTDIFGQETVGKFAALLGIGSKRLAELTDNVGDADGSLALALEQMEGLLEVGRKLWQAIKNIAITFGTPLLDPLTAATKAIFGLVAGFRSILKENPRLATALALTTGGILGLIVATSGIMIAVTSFKLLVIAVTKVGTAFLIAQLKAFGLIAAFILTGFLLVALFDEILSLFTGQESILGDLIAQNKQWEGTIKGVTAAVGILLAVSTFLVAPWLLIVALLIAATIAIVRNRKEWGEFFDMLSTTPLGEVARDFALWLLSLVGLDEAVKDLFEDFVEFWEWISSTAWTTIGEEFANWAKELFGINRLLNDIKSVAGITSFTAGGTTAPVGAGGGLSTLTAPFGPTTAPFTPIPGGGGGPATGGGRIVNLDVGGINISGVTDPIEVGRIVRREFDDVTREAADALAED